MFWTFLPLNNPLTLPRPKFIMRMIIWCQLVIEIFWSKQKKNMFDDVYDDDDKRIYLKFYW